ncbi:hypothetical protein [Enterobacter sp. 638]|uniref:Ead/Ea22-like family protein n=1 Tax=Enterobacter sp. (strain 638) TaxID=399742 RepID=A0A9J9KXZ4_ENT38|nr:hypothetical protein [Enterobacter sp. 638]ABP59699.1 hypothetical protein Ent638_1016 [Enterobacter sp. 638]
MTMTLIEMDGFLRGKCLPGDMKVNETNAEYLVRKFAEAEAQLTSLTSQLESVVAENAALKSKAAELVHEASEVYSAYNSTITEPDGDFMDMQTLQEMQSVETPATDAFLAEVRASGIDQWIASRDGRWNGTSAEAQRFAAQIRQGGSV